MLWRRQAFTLIETLVVIAIISVLIGLLVPAVQKVRGAAHRNECANHLKQIGIALQMHHAQHEYLPAGVTLPQAGEQYPLMGWLTRLLPYVEQEALWKVTDAAYRFDPDYPFAPPHAGIRTPIKIYACPADGRLDEIHDTHNGLKVACGSYLGNSGVDHSQLGGVLFGNSKIRLNDITDGTSNTLAVGERPPSADFWYGWWYAGGDFTVNGIGDTVLGVREVKWPEASFVPGCEDGPYSFCAGLLTNQCDVFHFWSLHSGGANFVMCDGSVHFLTYSADKILPALATRAGNDPVELP